MLFTTVLATLKVPLNTLAVNASVPLLESRVAELISTSEGELTRVGTLLSKGPESKGKIWYNSTSTCVIFASGVPEGTNPIIVARLITVVSTRMKSSAVSVSTLLALAGRDAAPSRPSGAPVVKKKVSAHAGVASHAPKANVATVRLVRNLITTPLATRLIVLPVQRSTPIGRRPRVVLLPVGNQIDVRLKYRAYRHKTIVISRVRNSRAVTRKGAQSHPRYWNCQQKFPAPLQGVEKQTEIIMSANAESRLPERASGDKSSAPLTFWRNLRCQRPR